MATGQNLRVVIVGGVACGPKAASRLRRLMPEAEITLIERDEMVSYGSCGIPYFVEGVFDSIDALIETPAKVKRTPEFFEKAKGFKVLTRTEAVRIDTEAKTVLVKDLNTGKEYEIPYDKLVLATGASPLKPPIPGVDKRNVCLVRNLDDASRIKSIIDNEKPKSAVIVGGGYIGIEMAEALKTAGLDVYVVEMLDQIFPQFIDREFALIAEKFMRSKGVEIYTQERVLEIVGDDKVKAVKTDKREIPADMVIVAVGVRPNDQLARDAGLACSPKGGILVNNYCQTSNPDIYAGGDCVVNQYITQITGQPLYVPLGSTANKHGRVIANHIAGMITPYPGITATSICKIFDMAIGRAGMTETLVKSLGIDCESVVWSGPDKPHYMEGKPLIIKIVASKKYRRLLGVQVIGFGDVAKRVDVAATALFFQATLDQMAYLDLAYAPPFAPPLDPIIVASHVLLNKMNGLANGLNPLEAKKWMDEKSDIILLDVRTPDEFNQMRLEDDRVVHIPLGALRQKLSELPKDKDILAFCKVSMRGYEAQRILNAAGYDRVWFIEGGLIGWPFKVWMA